MHLTSLENLLPPTPSADPGLYSERLQTTMAEKLFFLERLPEDVTVFADFGCSDGALLRNIAYRKMNQPLHALIGYDIDEPSIAKARKFNRAGYYEFTSQFSMMAARLQRYHREGFKSCLVLSSVVHELLSIPGSTFNGFWKIVRELGCDYVAIRDMAMERQAHEMPLSQAEHRAVLATEELNHPLVYSLSTPGHITSRSEMVEVMLKSQYRDDWEKEYAETYFPMPVEQWLNVTSVASGYRLRHFDHTSLPYLRRYFKNLTGLDVPDPTHMKLLLQKETN